MDRRALILVELIDAQTAVARPGREHDRPRLHALARAKADMARVVTALELHRLVGDREFDAELLRLAEGTPHQRHARNAGREAEVILDLRRGRRLAAERSAIDGQ